MAINLDKIKNAGKKMNPEKDDSSSKKTENTLPIWRPDRTKTATYDLRIVPSKDDPENPLTELYFHYDIAGKTFLCPNRVKGEKDPICDFASFMWKKYEESGKEDKNALNLFKKMMPDMRVYVPVLVRGEEENGVVFWGFGKRIYEKLITTIVSSMEKDEIDICDVNDGLDLEVTIISKDDQPPHGDTDFTTRRKTTPLASSKKEIQRIVESCPSIHDVFKFKSNDEMEEALNQYLDGTSYKSESTGLSKYKNDNASKASATEDDEDEKDFDAILEGLEDGDDE